MAIKRTIYIPDAIEKRIGELPPDVSVAQRINDMLDRYGVAIAQARREVLPLLDESERYMLKAACISWLTRGEPAEILLYGLIAELEDAALPGGDLAGQDVSTMLGKLKGMSPIHQFALIEWLESGDIHASAAS